VLNTGLFDFPIPEELIAQSPAQRRDESRLLVVDRARHAVAHHRFRDLPGLLARGDTLFRNDASVLPARLRAVRPTGGRVECLLVRPEGAGRWRCLVRPGRRLPEGETFADPHGAFEGKVVGKAADGAALVEFRTPGGAPMTEVARRMGEVPLPPYIRRKEGRSNDQDRERYQTVYADPGRPVAVAAPTAGLHFTPELLEALSTAGVGAATLTLHVGLGTFKPISTATVEEHEIHRELYEIPAATAAALASPGGRRVAVGTTAVRAIEDYLASAPPGSVFPHVAEASIFIHPPRAFRGVDALITNFHQPRSTLLCLVSAFLSPGSEAGIAWLREIYAEAVASRYRFFSYGDAMLIL
jgi:S-adenosylmethionine:tRNA ribosyltransferase-isomerase